MSNSIVSRAIETLREEGIRSFSKYAANYARHCARQGIGVVLLPYALLRTKGLTGDCTLDGLLGFVFNDCAGLIKPAQVYSEISELLRFVNAMKPRVILEIGTAKGGTLFLFSRLVSEYATIISIDLGGYWSWRIPLYRSFILRSQNLYLLRMNSHKGETLEQVKAILDGREIDFLFIDADHTYEGVKKDFEMYGPLVKKGGILAFHDIAPCASERGFGVGKLWEEIKPRYNHLELIEERHQNWAGIGIIYMPMSMNNVPYGRSQAFEKNMNG
jgi:hypothetical protein